MAWSRSATALEVLMVLDWIAGLIALALLVYLFLALLYPERFS
jgi:K+-transporting ATPase KdpF subunit